LTWIELPRGLARSHTGRREDAVIAHAANLVVFGAAYETAVRLYPRDTIQYPDGARIIARSDQKGVMSLA
jgi:hypothetical protein